jgi:hypothetical protein
MFIERDDHVNLDDDEQLVGRNLQNPYEPNAAVLHCYPLKGSAR